MMIPDHYLMLYMATFLRQLQYLVVIGAVMTTVLVWTSWNGQRLTVLNYTNERPTLIVPNVSKPTYRMPKLGAPLYV